MYVIIELFYLKNKGLRILLYKCIILYNLICIWIIILLTILSPYQYKNICLKPFTPSSPRNYVSDAIIFYRNFLLCSSHNNLVVQI
jgi:hypothetical protein